MNVPLFGLAGWWWDVGAEFSPDLPLCFAPGCVAGLLVLLTPCQQHPSPTPFPLIWFWDSFLNTALQGLPTCQKRHKGETNVLLPDHQNNHKYTHIYIHSTYKHKHTKTHTHTNTCTYTHRHNQAHMCTHTHRVHNLSRNFSETECLAISPPTFIGSVLAGITSKGFLQ